MKLQDVSTLDPLGNSGPFGSMCTHRVRSTDLTQIDGELIELA
ncbi:MAG: hypothetical protein AAFO99_15575 [Bacteroidota bacterium]